MDGLEIYALVHTATAKFASALPISILRSFRQICDGKFLGSLKLRALIIAGVV